ncbi:hypothetical protein ACFE04_006484 [Oxalis oulophora]
MSTTTTPVAVGDQLPSPTLDAEFSTLLQNISSHGGYAYVSMATLAAGDFRAAEAARDMAWEQLHSGPWNSVLPVWRDAYSMSCFHVAKHHYTKNEFKDALKVLDLGLIMGGLLFRQDLEAAVDLVTVKLRVVTVTDTDTDRGATAVDGGERRVLVGLSDNEMGKGQFVLNLPKRSFCFKRVVKRANVSMEAFLNDYFLSASPVIFTDCMNHWPAITKWNDFNYLTNAAGNRTVPVEVGKNYLCPEWKQELITFSDFLKRIQSNDSSPGSTTYLAQHPLFEQITELRNDISIPDYCFTGGGEIRSLNAWFGPAGTVTPLHHDPHHNILAQVVGKKYIRLYPASLSEELYPYSETMLCNSSQVDLDNIDEARFPKFQDSEFLDCILEEGEMLYIPPKWWHYVKSLTVSLSVSFWWGISETSAES